jgi:hypothetical protein
VVKEEFCVWVSGEPASVAGSIARALERELAGRGATVVLATERASVSAAAPNRAVVEVVVGAVPSGDGPAGDATPGPDVVVPGDGARAGESARMVLRHLAAAGWAEPLDDYSDDDEAAVSGRLQAFGYL